MQNNTHTKRVKNLIVLSVISAVILSVSTYAWFIGMRTVNVASFDVTVKTTESLMLSLDGANWSYSLDLTNKATLESAYTGNTNKWSSLIPVSTVGDMDVTASRMKLFEKTSYTATAGGYRLISTRMNNNEEVSPGVLVAEEDGYLVFDLFVRNFSGNDYIETLNEADEEAIYLTKDSTAKIDLIGDPLGVDQTGIENSVRVAFTQIGRVIGTTTVPATITGITCNPADDGEGNIVPSLVGGVTGICRTATIWEPNDTKHVDGAIKYYDTACKERTGAEIRGTGAQYSAVEGSCGDIASDAAYPTYAVKNEIGSADKVDIYDGTEYNTYTGTTKLLAIDTFSDTEKSLPGKARPQFMTLAANSITKLRIYVYIEGQDIDNYNFSEIGKRISINFGFTKERYVPGDIEYTGPNLPPEAEQEP